MLNIVLFGPPGAGKGTQSKKLTSHFNLRHLSTGDLLRSEIKNGTELGKKAKSLIDAGELVPDEVVIGMIKSRIDGENEAEGFIFDGFPRTEAQAEALDKLLKERNTAITRMVALDVPHDELVQRLVERGRETGRSDDNEETIKQRLRVYEEETSILKNYYRKQDKFETIDGTGSIDDVFARLKTSLEAVAP